MSYSTRTKNRRSDDTLSLNSTGDSAAPDHHHDSLTEVHGVTDMPGTTNSNHVDQMITASDTVIYPHPTHTNASYRDYETDSQQSGNNRGNSRNRTARQQKYVDPSSDDAQSSSESDYGTNSTRRKRARTTRSQYTDQQPTTTRARRTASQGIRYKLDDSSSDDAERRVPIVHGYQTRRTATVMGNGPSTLPSYHHDYEPSIAAQQSIQYRSTMDVPAYTQRDTHVPIGHFTSADHTTPLNDQPPSSIDGSHIHPQSSVPHVSDSAPAQYEPATTQDLGDPIPPRRPRESSRPSHSQDKSRENESTSEEDFEDDESEMDDSAEYASDAEALSSSNDQDDDSYDSYGNGYRTRRSLRTSSRKQQPAFSQDQYRTRRSTRNVSQSSKYHDSSDDDDDDDGSDDDGDDEGVYRPQRPSRSSRNGRPQRNSSTHQRTATSDGDLDQQQHSTVSQQDSGLPASSSSSEAPAARGRPHNSRSQSNTERTKLVPVKKPRFLRQIKPSIHEEAFIQSYYESTYYSNYPALPPSTETMLMEATEFALVNADLDETSSSHAALTDIHSRLDDNSAGSASKGERPMDPTLQNQQTVKNAWESIGGHHDHIKALHEMVVLPLLYPSLFDQFGISPPKGVLFTGPPGTGKTLTARTLATMCQSLTGKKVSFFVRKGADCLSKWVGETERQLRLLFEQAKEQQPSIIFFDEIDGLAPVRSSNQDQVHASIVSTLLALMDGLDSRGNIIVIGATNRIDSIDPALRRPGRFDRELYFNLPTAPERLEILKIHVRKWTSPVQPSLLQRLSQLTAGYSGADLQMLCTEASLRALRRSMPHLYAFSMNQSHPSSFVTISQSAKPTTQSSSSQVMAVTAEDFLAAMKGITPSHQRSTQTIAKKLNPTMELLYDAPGSSGHGTMSSLAYIASRVQRIFPYLESATDASGLDAFRVADASSSPRLGDTFSPSPRPSLLLHGAKNYGQQYLSQALLYVFQEIPTYSLTLPSLMGKLSTHSLEEACLDVFAEAKKTQPSIIYWGAIHQWLDRESLSPLVSLIILMLEELQYEHKILLIGDTNQDVSHLPRDIYTLFHGPSGNRISIDITKTPLTDSPVDMVKHLEHNMSDADASSPDTPSLALHQNSKDHGNISTKLSTIVHDVMNQLLKQDQHFFAQILAPDHRLASIPASAPYDPATSNSKKSSLEEVTSHGDNTETSPSQSTSGQTVNDGSLRDDSVKHDQTLIESTAAPTPPVFQVQIAETSTLGGLQPTQAVAPASFSDSATSMEHVYLLRKQQQYDEILILHLRLFLRHVLSHLIANYQDFVINAYDDYAQYQRECLQQQQELELMGKHGVKPHLWASSDNSSISKLTRSQQQHLKLLRYKLEQQHLFLHRLSGGDATLTAYEQPTGLSEASFAHLHDRTLFLSDMLTKVNSASYLSIREFLCDIDYLVSTTKLMYDITTPYGRTLVNRVCQLQDSALTLCLGFDRVVSLACEVMAKRLRQRAAFFDELTNPEPKVSPSSSLQSGNRYFFWPSLIFIPDLRQLTNESSSIGSTTIDIANPAIQHLYTIQTVRKAQNAAQIGTDNNPTSRLHGNEDSSTPQTDLPSEAGPLPIAASTTVAAKHSYPPAVSPELLMQLHDLADELSKFSSILDIQALELLHSQLYMCIHGHHPMQGLSTSVKDESPYDVLARRLIEVLRNFNQFCLQYSKSLDHLDAEIVSDSEPTDTATAIAHTSASFVAPT